MPFSAAEEQVVEAYRIRQERRLLTPALLIYPEIVDANIRTTIAMAAGDANRWRPHVKTAKIPFVMQRMMDFGVSAFKCSTTLELATLCALGASDVLLAFPISGANAARVRQLADLWPKTRVSVLIENKAQEDMWKDSAVSLFIDINPGMDRTGISPERADDVLALAKRAADRKCFGGLHYYDGHLGGIAAHDRERAAQEGYGTLLKLLRAIEQAGVAVPEVITSGTPVAPYAISYPPFSQSGFVHRISPGTVVYNDLNSLEQLSAFDYRPAVLVLSTVVSHPADDVITCDAGHKAVSVDSGTPNCAVLGWPNLLPQKPSEEHLPIRCIDKALSPEIGAAIYLLPKHVCPTVNNFDEAVVVKGGVVERIEKVAARGHESPLILQ